MSNAIKRARTFLGGAQLSFKEADLLWRELKAADEISLARAVIARVRRRQGLRDPIPPSQKDTLCRQEALLTSMDPEQSASLRHDRALEILGECFDLSLNNDGETLGIAGGIWKRRWRDLGQFQDLKRAADVYERGAKATPLGEDAYPHINAAFLDDLLAAAGDDPVNRRERARALRSRIADELPVLPGNWWNVATRAETLFGLRRYEAATEALATATGKPPLWERQSTTRQLAHLAHLQEDHPLEVPAVRAFFEALLPGAPEAVSSAMLGKVGLALSGGGFRASFYHLGVLARLAELDLLKDVEALSCVSGGSIVGACYWLALRRRMLKPEPLHRDGYVALVKEVIAHFMEAVSTDLRGPAKSKLGIAWRLLRGKNKGVFDSEKIAQALDESFYRPLLGGDAPCFMHDLPFQPADHNPDLAGSPSFDLGKHNWLRRNKVPVLAINATTVNTGHAWQFTPTWMGESPWAVHDAADSVPRLQWSWYEPSAGWKIELARAVMASACVPMVFEPVPITAGYDGVDVHLVDGGVYDNQGTVSLLALNCTVVLVSDASGQLLFESKPAPGVSGLVEYGKRSMDTLSARIRLANYVDLESRCRSGLLRGLMFQHMKEGLDADTIRLRFSQEAYALERAPLSPAGVRKDFQQALAELRTDLDVFTPEEAHGLMACGYQMAGHAFERDLGHLPGFSKRPRQQDEWPFAQMLAEISSVDPHTDARQNLLATLREGNKLIP